MAREAWVPYALPMSWLFIAEWAVRLVMFVVIVTRKRSATAALAWLAVVAFVPFLGALAYITFGEIRLGLRRSREYLHLQEAMTQSQELRQLFARIGQAPVPADQRLIANLAGAVGAREPRPGNQLELMDDPRALFDRVVRDIDTAASHCHLLFYIADDYKGDPITRSVTDALVRARERGVACRMLLDAAGSRRFLRGGMATELREAGVELVAALPVNPLRAMGARLDLRNHRKLVVVDGRVAYLGSHNLTDPVYPGKEAYGEWMDASVRVNGPVVYDLQEVFLHDWAFNAETLPRDASFFPPSNMSSDGVVASVLPTAPSLDRTPLLDVILQTLRMATERVVLTTPYFVPDDSILNAMRAAALRGVEVVLVVPKKSDHKLAAAAGRSHYGYLLEAGVQILESPGALLHAQSPTSMSAASR